MRKSWSVVALVLVTVAVVAACGDDDDDGGGGSDSATPDGGNPTADAGGGGDAGGGADAGPEPLGCDPGPLEPNEDMAGADDLPGADPGGLGIPCAEDHDWYRVAALDPEKLYVIGVSSDLAAGDLDVDMVDAAEAFFGWSYTGLFDYHSENTPGPVDFEGYSLVGAAD